MWYPYYIHILEKQDMVKSYKKSWALRAIEENICILELFWKWFHNLSILHNISLVNPFIFIGLTTLQKLGMLHSDGLQLSYV